MTRAPPEFPLDPEVQELAGLLAEEWGVPVLPSLAWLVPQGERCFYNTHNSDLRDSHECIKKQVWGERIITRQHSRGFNLVETRPT